jgi:hypothetical protein
LGRQCMTLLLQPYWLGRQCMALLLQPYSLGRQCEKYLLSLHHFWDVSSAFDVNKMVYN